MVLVKGSKLLNLIFRVRHFLPYAIITDEQHSSLVLAVSRTRCSPAAVLSQAGPREVHLVLHIRACHRKPPQFSVLRVKDTIP